MMELACKIQLSNGTTVAMFTVNSSNIYAVGYIKEKEELYVEFLDGSVYVYYGVEPELWRMLQIVDSKGSFLHHYIKINDTVYQYEEITGLVNITYVGQTTNPGTPHPEGYMTDKNW